MNHAKTATIRKYFTENTLNAIGRIEEIQVEIRKDLTETKDFALDEDYALSMLATIDEALEVLNRLKWRI